MNPLVVEGEVAATNFALLTDRVLVARGEPQGNKVDLDTAV